MADDALGFRGLAQVVRGPNVGNLYALAQMKQRQEALEAERADKRRKEDLDLYSKAIELKKTPLRIQLTEYTNEIDRNTLDAMRGVYYNAQKGGGMSFGERQALNEIKANRDEAWQLAQATNTQLDELYKFNDQNKTRINQEYFLQKLSNLEKGAFSRDNKGNLVFNEETAINLKNFVDDPKMWNMVEFAKDFKTDLGLKKSEIFNPSNNMTETFEWTNILETTPVNVGGKTILKPKLDANGEVIVQSTPEALALWNQNSVRKEGLKAYAEERGYKNTDGTPDLGKAFQSLMGNVVDYKTDVAHKFPPGYGAGYTAPAPSISPANTAVNKPLSGVRASGGIAGYKGSEQDLQWISDAERKVRIQHEGKPIDIEYIKFGIGENGEKGIWGAKIDPKSGKPGEAVFIPITGEKDPNVQLLFNKRFVGGDKTRSQLVSNFRDFMRSPVEQVPVDEGKITEVQNTISDAFESGENDTDIAESVRNYLNDLGVNTIKKTGATGKPINQPLIVKANQKTFPWGWNTININGQDFDLNDEKDVGKMMELIYENSDKSNFYSDGEQPESPEQQSQEPIKIINENDYYRIPKGTEYIDPDGVRRIKQ